MSAAAWDNAIFATHDSPFLADLALAVGNDPSHAAAVRYWLSACGADNSPWRAWDENINTLENVGKLWPVFHEAANALGAQDVMPRVARVVCDRWQAAMRDLREILERNPVTVCVAMAERAHDLVGLLHAGVRFNGSADPYAIRRMAKEWLILAAVRRRMNDD